jgi:hypothetical protein
MIPRSRSNSSTDVALVLRNMGFVIERLTATSILELEINAVACVASEPTMIDTLLVGIRWSHSNTSTNAKSVS